MGKSLTDKLNDLPDKRRERILSAASRLYAERLPTSDGHDLCEAEEPPTRRLEVRASPE